MLNSETLKNLILSNMRQVGWDLENAPQAENFANIISQAVVEHIKTAQVTVQIVGGSSAGIATGTIL